MLYEKNKIGIRERAELENIKSELARQQAAADYIAMMADVEIPAEEEGDEDVV